MSYIKTHPMLEVAEITVSPIESETIENELRLLLTTNVTTTIMTPDEAIALGYAMFSNALEIKEKNREKSK